MWFIVSSLSLHNSHLLFCCVLSILALTSSVLMALFCAAIRRDSVYLLRFLLATSKFSCERFRLFIAWNFHRVVFLPIFVFWLFLFCWCLFYLLFLVAVVFLSLYRCIDTILNAAKISSSFSWHIQSVNDISGCKALCLVISFLVLWSLYWSSSLVHFKNSPEYLIKGTVQVFTPLMRFLLCSLV